MQLYDMHSHILPNFDDGSESVEESLEMLNCLSAQNVNNVCFTPHFYSNKTSVDTFALLRYEAYSKFLPHKPKKANIVLGAEVYVTHYLFSNTDISQLTYGKSRYILTEFPYASSFDGKSADYLWEIINNFNLIPVIPHVERYDALLNNTDKIEELKDLGVIIQTNIGNYAKKAPFFARQKLLKLINNGYIDIIGSDSHSMVKRTPEVFGQALDCISSKCGQDRVEKMMSTAKKIFDEAYEE